MATSKSKADIYANIAAVNVVEAAAGTAAYTKFAFPFSIMDKMALIINRIEYVFSSLAQLNTSGDYVLMGLTVASGVASLLALNDPLILDTHRVDRYDMGTAASGVYRDSPVIRDFSDLPGGGLLVAPNPLYGAIISVGSSGVMGGWVRMYYTYMEMATDEYWQLVESRRVISS
jgi:hypothetical protein